MQFVGKMLLYFWEKLACESIPKFPNPNCNKLGNNSSVSLSVKHVLNKI